ncbi:MAG: PilZ domain-containing protein [Thermoanaerobaculales bacterium]|nr:PilZ domain-containing protein [Thermoanaerobaculales bacterium]
MRANILVVEVGPESYDDVAPPLLRSLFDIDRIPGAESALDLVTNIAFNAIICRFPLREIPTNEFLKTTRSSTSASREAGVALIASAEHFDEASTFLEKGADLVLSMEEPQGEREALLCTLFGIQPRRSMRVLVKLAVVVGEDGPERFVAQTHDISASGMFVVTRKHFQVGMTARFQFSLMGESRAFTGTAEIVRHNKETTNGPRGFGMRFLDFEEPDAAEHLDRCLAILKK